MESGSESEGGATFKLLWKRSLEKVKTKQIVDHLVDEAKKSSSDLSDSSVLDPAPAGSEEAEKDAKKQKATAAAFRMPEAAALMYRVVAWKKCLAKNLVVSDGGDDYGGALKFLTEQWIAESLPDFKGPLTYECKSIEGLGFLSKTFRVSLKASAEEGSTQVPATLILKLPGTFEESFQVIADETDAYRREHNFYSKIVPILDEIASRNPEGKTMRVPKVYKTELVQNGARILMEDLGTIGYSVNQIDGLKPEPVKVLIEMAASLHAAFWQGNEGSTAIPDFVVKGDDPRSFIRRWNDGFVNRYEEFLASKGLKAYDIGIDEEIVLEIGAKIFKNAKYILEQLCSHAPQTLIHADYRADNFMLLHSGSCAVLDWQLHSTGPGAYDLVDVMIKSMTVDDGVSNCEQLLKTYHSNLVEAGVTNYSFESLWRDFRLSILQQIMLVFDVAHDGIGANGELIADWSAFELCRCMFKRLVKAIVDLKCLDLLD